MKPEIYCVVCRNIIKNDLPAFSIFKRDPSSGKCLAYKLSQICGEEFISEEHGTFSCTPCHDLLNTIFYLEQDIFKKFKAFSTNSENQLCANFVEEIPKVEINDEETVFENPSSEIMDELDDSEKVENIAPDFKQEETFQCSDTFSLNENNKVRNPLDDSHIDSFQEDSLSEPQSFEGKSNLIKCKICKDVFKSKDSLRGHMKIHDGDKPFKCQDCDQAFVKSSNLKQHRRHHTGEKFCYKCQTLFNDQSGIDEHRKQESYNCVDCETSFFECIDLWKHKRSHQTAKISRKNDTSENICEICKKSFMRMRTLRAHITHVHDGEKSLVCEDCGKSFSRRKSLVDHRIVHHSSERSYKCHLCVRSYFLKSHLSNHIKKGHPTSLDHECEHCGKRFPLNSILTLHKKDVHEKVPCHNCGRLVAPRDLKRQRHKCKVIKLKSKLDKVTNGDSLLQLSNQTKLS